MNLFPTEYNHTSWFTLIVVGIPVFFIFSGLLAMFLLFVISTIKGLFM